MEEQENQGLTEMEIESIESEVDSGEEGAGSPQTFQEPQDETYQIEDVESITPNVVVDLLRTKETIVVTGKGKINVIHEITLGDAIISMLLTCILIFMVLNRFIQRR